MSFSSTQGSGNAGFVKSSNQLRRRMGAFVDDEALTVVLVVEDD